MLVAEIFGEARHHARWRDLGQEVDPAAGEGASEGELDEPRARRAAQLCRDAGADPAMIPGWIEEGRRRRANASLPPFSAPRSKRAPGSA